MPQADIVTIHRFYPGIYERTVIIPPWTVLSGAEHKTDYSVRLERGIIAVNTDEGMKVLTGPMSFPVKAGLQRIGRVLGEKVIWVDTYENPDNCQDLKLLEQRLYVVPECDLGDNRRIALDRADYESFVKELGISQERIEQIVTNHDDMVEPLLTSVELRESQIHGLGLFALEDFKQGQLICPGRLGEHRTPAGRYINHSMHPNTESYAQDDDIWAKAKRNILKGEEILTDYREAVRVNTGLLEALCQPG